MPDLEEWDKSQSGNLVGNSLVGTCLTLPNLGFLWVFFKYPKISKNGNTLFFPVMDQNVFLIFFVAHQAESLGHLCQHKGGWVLVEVSRYQNGG